MPQFDEKKLRDFFVHFNESSPQHKEAVKRLYAEIKEANPKLLSDEAYWVQAYRTRPTPAPVPIPATTPVAGKVSVQSKIHIQAQHMPKSCGQTCVAMCIEYLGKKIIDDYWVDRHYKYDLVGALNVECGGRKWADVGDFKASMWDAIRGNLAKGWPTIIGLNGPEFSPSGYGHIVLITSIDVNNVGIADPNGGVWRTVSKKLIETCPAHTEGKFVFMVTG